MDDFFCERTRRMARTTTATLCLLFAGSSVFAEPGGLTQERSPRVCISETGSVGCTDGHTLKTAMSVAVSPDGHHVYVGAPNSHGLAAFSRNGTTGLLTQLATPAGCVTESGDGGCAVGRSITTIRTMAFSADGKHVYAAAQFSNAVAAFTRNRRTGALTQLPGTTGCISETGSDGLCIDGRGLDDAWGVAVSPDGRNVYVTGNVSAAITIFARNQTTGALTQLPGTAGCISETGSDGECTDGRALKGASTVVVSEDGKFVYVAGSGSGGVAVFSRDRTTGALTQLPGADGCVSQFDATCAYAAPLDDALGLTLSRDGRSVYVTSTRSGANAVVALSRNRTTGVLTQLPGSNGCISKDGNGGACIQGRMLETPISVVVSRDDRTIYVASSGSDAVTAFRRDRTTGVLTQMSGVQGCITETYDGDDLCTLGRGLNSPFQLAISSDGKHLYAASTWDGAVTTIQRER